MTKIPKNATIKIDKFGNVADKQDDRSFMYVVVP